MIYSNLKGGLGNMMFEIAALESLAYDNMDQVGFINVPSQIAYLNSETNFNPNMQHADEYSFLIGKYQINAPASYVAQFNAPYHFEKLQYVKGAFYDGFYQSEKWFKHNRPRIIDQLAPSKNIVDIIEAKYSDLLALENSVAVHVRRGDYVKNQGNHAVLPLEYYEKAMEHFSPDHDYVIFSDDINWCKEIFKMPRMHFVQDKDYVEIYLMSMMKNCITANSSFSWWGGWLNLNRNKKIIGPSVWFGPNIRHNTADIIPDWWIKL